MAESSPLSRDSFMSSSSGTKRPASALLPSFDLSSSPPGLPGSSKRVKREPECGGGGIAALLPSALSDELENRNKWPTPMPTSETNVFSSSPPAAPAAVKTRAPPATRPPLQRTVSSLSQREPLGAVPTAELDAAGTEMLFGRSGKSSHFQLHSLNKNISRVHLRAAYVPATTAGPASPQPARVEILCKGWNGMKVHCQGRHWEMNKHDSFTSEAQGTDIMVDIADTRVVIQWPKIGRKVDTPDTSEDEAELEESPSRRAARLLAQQSSSRRVTNTITNSSAMQSGTAAAAALLPSPKPSRNNSSEGSRDGSGEQLQQPAVQIYEDQDESEHEGDDSAMPGTTQASTQILSQFRIASSAPVSFQTPQDFSDADEENDPVVHSFGPMGANLLPKLASFHAGASPEQQQRRPLQPLKDNLHSPGRAASGLAESSGDLKIPARIIDVSSHPVVNHVVNQLAFSRLSKLPISMIMNHLPTDLKTGRKQADAKDGEELGQKEAEQDNGEVQDDGQGNTSLSFDELRALMAATHCIGEVARVGKDAAGMPLESEYYYIPENDFDESRKEAIVGQLRKPGLRACRKQHKQYFWRKPK